MRKSLIIFTLISILTFICSACGKIEITSETAVGIADDVMLDNQGTPKSANANLFICGEPSMMGFADWKHDTMYETTVSLLLDRLSSYPLKLYRYDRYNIGAEAQSVADAATLKKDVRELSFYSSEGLSAESSIPSTVRRYNSDQLGALTGVNAYLSAETREAAGAGTAYPLENALRLFEKDALNIVVTDLYELRNGGFEKLNALNGYDIGILAVRSEYAGGLTGLASDDATISWGSPRTGSYKSHSVKKASYKKDDGTTAYYNYNVFTAYSSDERVSENRTFFIIFAGNSSNIGDVMSSVRSKIVEKYANSDAVTPDLGVFGIFSAQCVDIKTDADAANGYIIYADDELYEGALSYEIRESDEVPALRLTAKYAIDTGAGAIIPTEKDFEIMSTCIKIGSLQKEYDSKPAFSVGQIGDGFIVPTLTYDAGHLPKGEYLYETTISAKVVGQAPTKVAFLEQWGIEIDDGTLRHILSAYASGGEEGVTQMRNFMLKTPGLSYLFEHIAEPPAKTEILKVKVYIKVV